MGMFSRPLAFAATGLVAGALTAADIIHLKRRSNMTTKIFAETTRYEPNKLLTSSSRLYEAAKFVGSDEVSPDLIADVTRELTNDLLNQSSARGVALDWAGFRLFVFDQFAEDTTQIIARVDVL